MATLFESAVKSMQAGQLAEAERLCRDILAAEPNNAAAIHLLGFIAYQSGRPKDAIDLIGRAIALDEKNPDCHFNIGLALLAAGRLPEAVIHFNRATELKPDYASAISNLVNLAFNTANQALAQNRLDDAVGLYQQVIALKPNYSEAHSNLGVALMARGYPMEAAEAYRRALEINPNLAMTCRNLGRALMVQGDLPGALALARRALELSQTDDIKRFFVEAVRAMPPAQAAGFEDIEPHLARALAEAWGRPEEIAGFAAALVKRRLTPQNALLDTLLQSAPVRDIELERWLTQERRRLLEGGAEAPLSFACALARQCFINEYVFARSAEESQQVARLREAASGDAIAPLQLALLAAYMPLHSLPNAEKMLERTWPAPLNAVVDQQIREPLEELADRKNVPVLTPIGDATSQAVREQYEEMPYPRWVKPALVGAPIPLDHYVRGQFRFAPLRPLASDRPDILVAGCGTGQHPIETARRYVNARVLAVDLSLSSLSYARRMTRALAVNNVEYAQADILKLGAIGRSFDLIESAGVLHHLADPLAGWRILASLLRPGGLMLVGLYSGLARKEVNLAREFLAKRGYGSTADDIRRGRQDLMALADDDPLKSVTGFPDFYATSTCRDLIFHVQEHQFSIPDIKSFVGENGLTFIGFSTDPGTQLYYRGRFPQDAAMTDLDCWHALEREIPALFKTMYQFWVQKP